MSHHARPLVPSPRHAADDEIAEHERLREQLRAAGWRRVDGRVGRYDRMRSPSQLVTILVPLSPTVRGYADELSRAWAIWQQVCTDAGRPLPHVP
ncbi:hypothetical protein [Microcystis phage Mwe-JY05]